MFRESVFTAGKHVRGLWRIGESFLADAKSVGCLWTFGKSSCMPQCV